MKSFPLHLRWKFFLNSNLLFVSHTKMFQLTKITWKSTFYEKLFRGCLSQVWDRKKHEKYTRRKKLLTQFTISHVFYNDNVERMESLAAAYARSVEKNPREKWSQIKLIFLLFHVSRTQFSTNLTKVNAYLGNIKIKLWEALKWKLSLG